MRHPRDPKWMKKQLRWCQKFKKIRLRQKRTKAEIAAGSNLSSNYYGKIENGKTGTMGKMTFRRVRKGLGVKWEEFFKPNDPMYFLIFRGTEETDDENDKI